MSNIPKDMRERVGHIFGHCKGGAHECWYDQAYNKLHRDGEISINYDTLAELQEAAIVDLLEEVDRKARLDEWQQI